jgi:amidase
MININEITISDISKSLRDRTISVRELVQEYLERIKNMDRGENGLNSILEINPEAIMIAEKLEGNQTQYNNVLFGIPIILKDNIDTGDKMHTSAGSLALANLNASSDAEIVIKLREKGMVVLGKSNMTEFANYMTKDMPPGYSSRGGQVKSPYKKDGCPSGSSTGSAVAVTANLCTVSIGTDTGGSIISPSLNNSIVGFRPSMGAISQKGIIPISFTCDTAGPMTRTVEDAAILYSEITRNKVECRQTLDLKGVTVGVSESELNSLNKEEGEKADSIIRSLEMAGGVVQRIQVESISHESIKTIQKYEFKYIMNKYLSNLPKEFPIRNLMDIIEFNNQNKELALKYGQTKLIDAQDNTIGNLNEKEYIKVLREREIWKRKEMDIFKGIDYLIYFKGTNISQFTGLPSITIPHGLKMDGMPYGITLIGFTDVSLLQHAYHLEQFIGDRVVPKAYQ